jgi:hypothetical protein
MSLIIGADEIASETKVSEGWSYALFPTASLTNIKAAVTSCTVRTFHGKKFKKAQERDYKLFLQAVRYELEQTIDAGIVFTLMDSTWKDKFIPFAGRLISKSFQNVGVTDVEPITISKQLFPGLITLQRFFQKLSQNTIEVEIDSDSVSERLALSSAQMKGFSMPTAKLLETAFEAYRRKQFPEFPQIASGRLRALKDAKSVSIQIADVFGNFALSFVFHKLGHPSKTRAIKAAIFESVFGDLLKDIDVTKKAALSGSNDIRLLTAGALTLKMLYE